MRLVSYSQNREDVILWRALKDVKSGFYVDVGAAWPDTHSVTKVFYDRGWFGINIEPNPKFYASLCEQRSRDINLQIAVCDKDGEGNLSLFSDTGLSTLDPEVAEEHVRHRFDCVSLTIKTATLASLLQRFLPAKQEIHFLKIDVEGLESEVLAGNDWLVFRPWIVLVEATLPLSQVESHYDWEPTLTAAAYTFAYADGLNRFYVENGHLDLLECFRYPPNVFDEFVLASEVAAEESQRLAEVRAVAAEESQRRAEARAVAAEESQRLAEARAIAAEELQRLAEMRAVTASDELSAVVGSRSWRLLKPLREAAGQSRRLRGFAKSTVKRIVAIRSKVLMAHMLKSVKAFIERRPAVKNFCRIVLNKYPGIRFRISRALGAELGRTAGGDLVPNACSTLKLKRIEKIVSCIIDELRDQK